MATAAPVAPPETKQKKKTVKPKHPSVVKALENDGKGLTAVPDDFKIGGEFQLLREADFAAEHMDEFFKFKQTYHQRLADSFKSQAVSFGRIGGIADRATALKLLKHQDEIRKLVVQLSSDGADLKGLFTVEELAKLTGNGAVEEKK